MPDNTKRLAQELIVNDKVNVIAGFGVTPAAMAAAPLATQSKSVELVMAAGTSAITEASPYITRTSFTLAQVDGPDGAMGGQERHQEGRHHGVGLCPRHRRRELVQGAPSPRPAARCSQTVRFPLANPDFSPFLQRAADAKPDAIFVFVPSGQGGAFVKQFVERGLDKAGVKLIGPGDVTDDDLLNAMGDVMIGTVTAHLYSAAHPSAMNKAFVEAFKKAAGFRPNFMAVGGYDGMHLIYEALKKTGGKADGDSLDRRHEGTGLGEPARPGLDRSRYPRHRAEHLHPQGREGRRRALQRRVRDRRRGQGSGQGREKVSRFGSFGFIRASDAAVASGAFPCRLHGPGAARPRALQASMRAGVRTADRRPLGLQARAGASVRALVAQSAKSVFCAMTRGLFRYRLPPKNHPERKPHAA